MHVLKQSTADPGHCNFFFKKTRVYFLQTLTCMRVPHVSGESTNQNFIARLDFELTTTSTSFDGITTRAH
jgi:hypothetical protein